MKNLAAVIAVLLGILPSIVLAQSSQAERIADLEREVQTLRARVEALERALNAASKPAAVAIKPGSSRDIRNWRQLRKGMTEAEVENLLGAPGKVMTNEAFLLWYFNYPTGGDVRFDPDTQRVEAWNEP